MAAAAAAPGLDRATVVPIVRRAVGSTAAEVGRWSCRWLGGGHSGAAVWRVAGTARLRGDAVPWAVVLKALPPAAGAAGARPLEARLYAAGALDRLAGLAAPRCWGVDDRPGGATWLWLEHVAEAGGPRWPPARYVLAAEHLGRFNGAYLAGAPPPGLPGLGAGPLPARRARQAAAMARLRASRDEPLVRRHWPGDDAARALRLWAAYPAFRAALARAPRTFCHHDAFRRNLLARRAAAGREETVAIDWEGAGWGALGGDLAALLLTSAWFFALEAAEVRALDRAAFAAYAAGLRAAGWRGDPRRARLGYTATAALLGGLADVGLVEPDAASRRRVAAEVGRPYAAAVAHLAALRGFALDRADEARALLAALP